MKVTHLAVNQIIIHTEHADYFQSYGTMIAVRHNATENVTLDPYVLGKPSRTTMKYLAVFLKLPTSTIKQRIFTGRYAIHSLNEKV